MKALVFDLDGTLIDSAADIHLAASKVLKQENLPPITLDQTRSFVGHGAGILITRVMAAVGLPASLVAHQRLLDAFLAHYETAVQLTTLYPGVLDALATLQRDGWLLAICTNKPLKPTQAVLAHFNLLKTFPVIIGGDSLPQRKPDPQPLQAAIAALGGPVTLFVGDSEVDAETATRAGIDFALYTEGYRKSPIDTLPHCAAFDDFAALPGIAANWWQGKTDRCKPQEIC